MSDQLLLNTMKGVAIFSKMKMPQRGASLKGGRQVFFLYVRLLRMKLLSKMTK